MSSRDDNLLPGVTPDHALSLDCLDLQAAMIDLQQCWAALAQQIGPGNPGAQAAFRRCRRDLEPIKVRLGQIENRYYARFKETRRPAGRVGEKT